MGNKLDKYDKFTIGLSIALFIFASIMIFGCNAYKGIEKKPPLTSKDSSRLSERSLKTFPPKPQVIKQGKTIYIKDTSKLKDLRKIADSLKNRPKEIITIHDSCGKEANDGYESGYQLGLQIGRYDGLQDCEASTQRVDTLPRSHEDEVFIFDQNAKLQQAQKQIEINNTTISKLKDKISAKNILWLSFLSLFLLSSIGNLLQFKFKAKKVI